jgi:two-component system NtrC family sensor kinase
VFTSSARSRPVARSSERLSDVSTSFDTLIDERDRELVRHVLRETFSGLRKRVDLRYLSVTSDVRYCSLTLTPLHEGDTVAGALGIVRDVTDERRLTEQLIQQEKLAAVGQLVSGVAHELNNPLASVMAFAQLLLASPRVQHADERSAAEAINQEARRAAKIVSNLLTFARQHQPQRTITDLNRVVEDTLELRRYALRVAHVDVDVELDPELPMTWADPFQLQQVVLNLITNAEQAMVGAHGHGTLTVRVKPSAGGGVRVEIADDGPGVPADDLARIFNPFFTTKPPGEGRGLGLSVAYSIVAEHEGIIRAENRDAGGALFTIELPVGAAAVEPSLTP